MGKKSSAAKNLNIYHANSITTLGYERDQVGFNRDITEFQNTEWNRERGQKTNPHLQTETQGFSLLGLKGEKVSSEKERVEEFSFTYPNLYISIYLKKLWKLKPVRPAVPAGRFASLFFSLKVFMCRYMSSSIGIHLTLTLLKLYSNANFLCAFLIRNFHSKSSVVHIRSNLLT